MLATQSVRNIFTSPEYRHDMLEQMDLIGVGSLPIVVISSVFIGGVLVVQTAAQFQRFGETSLTGEVVSLSLVREFGPTITALLVAGRNASGIASELGSMVTSEQVDAMRALGTDPVLEARDAVCGGNDHDVSPAQLPFPILSVWSVVSSLRTSH